MDWLSFIIIQRSVFGNGTGKLFRSLWRCPRATFLMFWRRGQIEQGVMWNIFSHYHSKFLILIKKLILRKNFRIFLKFSIRKIFISKNFPSTSFTGRRGESEEISKQRSSLYTPLHGGRVLGRKMADLRKASSRHVERKDFLHKQTRRLAGVRRKMWMRTTMKNARKLFSIGSSVHLGCAGSISNFCLSY